MLLERTPWLPPALAACPWGKFAPPVWPRKQFRALEIVMCVSRPAGPLMARSGTPVYCHSEAWSLIHNGKNKE